MRTRSTPVLETERLVLWMPSPLEAARVLDYFRRNREHLEPWEPLRPERFYTRGFWERQLLLNREEYEGDRGLRLMLRPRHERATRVIGVANLSNVVRGVFQACQLGYSLDGEEQGRGLMHEALERVIAFARDELGLHRIQANHQPSNERSARVLERLGFEREGFARDYLFIDGAWRDHVLTAKVLDGAPDPHPGR